MRAANDTDGDSTKYSIGAITLTIHQHPYEHLEALNRKYLNDKSDYLVKLYEVIYFITGIEYTDLDDSDLIKSIFTLLNPTD